MKRKSSSRQSTDALTGLALILSIAALVIAWLAFSRSGPQLDERVTREVLEATSQIRTDLAETEKATAARMRELERQSRIAEARTVLAGAQAKLMAGEPVEAVAGEIADARRRLARAYASSEREVQERWRAISADLAIAGSDATADGATALQALDRALARLRPNGVGVGTGAGAAPDGGAAAPAAAEPPRVKVEVTEPDEGDA